MVRYFFLSLNVLNSLLALAVAAVAYFAVIPLLNPVARISLPAVKGTVTSSGEQTTPSQRVPVTDYAVISDKNLFRPERKMPLETQPGKAVPKPDVVLYGTLIGDDASYAFIEDKKAPYSTPGRGKRQVTLKKGDHLSGYTLERDRGEPHRLGQRGREGCGDARRRGKDKDRRSSGRAGNNQNGNRRHHSFLSPGDAILRTCGSFAPPGHCGLSDATVAPNDAGFCPGCAASQTGNRGVGYLAAHQGQRRADTAKAEGCAAAADGPAQAQPMI